MNNASKGPRQAWNDTVTDAPEEPPVGGRRLLLGGAAGGLVLAASGLLLPADLIEEVEAGNHPVRRLQSRKQQRRRKRRNAQKRRRTKNRRNPGSGWGTANVAISVHNHLPFAITTYGHEVHEEKQDFKELFQPRWTTQSINPPAANGTVATRDFIGDTKDVIVTITIPDATTGTSFQRYIIGINYFVGRPDMLLHNGAFVPHLPYPDDKQYLAGGNNDVGSSYTVDVKRSDFTTVAKITLTHIYDTAQHIRFLAEVWP